MSVPRFAAGGAGAPIPSAIRGLRDIQQHHLAPGSPPRRPLKGVRPRPTELQPVSAFRARASGARGGRTGPVGGVAVASRS